MKAAEMRGLKPLAQEPRLLEFNFNPRLVEILGKKNSQVINLLAGGNVPETPKDVARAIVPGEEKDTGIQAGRAEVIQRLTRLSETEDIPTEYRIKIDAYNRLDTTEKKLRFIDTSKAIQEQLHAFKRNIRGLVEQQRDTNPEIEDIVFTVCGASPPDLQAVRAIQQLNSEYAVQRVAGKKIPQLYAVMFLPGEDRDAILKYSVDTGLHPEVWLDAYNQAENDSNIFIHTPIIASQYANSLTNDGTRRRFADGEHPKFKEVRDASLELFEHNRAGNVDINRSITEFAHRPPIFGVFADSLELPKQLRGSGRELISRMLWMQHFYGVSFREAVKSIRIVQDGFVYALLWTKEKARELYGESKHEYDEESDQNYWPRAQAPRSSRVERRNSRGRYMEEQWGTPVAWGNGSLFSYGLEAIRRSLRHAS